MVTATTKRWWRSSGTSGRGPRAAARRSDGERSSRPRPRPPTAATRGTPAGRARRGVASTVAIHHACRGSNGAAGMPGSSGGNPMAGASTKTAKPARPQNKPWRHPIACPRRAKAAIEQKGKRRPGDDVRQQGEGVALEAVLRRPGLVLVGGLVVCAVARGSAAAAGSRLARTPRRRGSAARFPPAGRS